MIVFSKFSPAGWLRNHHFQTLFPTLTKRRIPAPIDIHERLELPDGDFIDLAWAINGLPVDKPLIILLHGLGGGVDSVYISGLLRAFNNAGFRAVLMHFRGASKEPNRLARSYHSGDTADLAYFLKVLQQREPLTQKAAVGISLGGNVLLKYLGESDEDSLLNAAVAVSVPFELQAVAEKMNQGFSRIYQAHLVSRLQQVFLKKLTTVNQVITCSKKELLALKTLYDFDEKITAPLNGFAHAKAYYQASSSRQYLAQIKTNCLIIHAKDDPFMTPEVIPNAEELSASTTLELSNHGGHVGFIDKNGYWLEKRIPEFLAEQFIT